jgi:hypothetical protein
MASFTLSRPSHRAAGFFTRAVACALAACAGLAAPASAAGPRDSLLGLVPEDAAFCLIIQDLRVQAEKLQASAWIKSIAQSDFAQELLKTPEARKLLALKEHVEKRLKTSLDRIRDDILGDAVVLAYRLGPPDKPDQDQGLVLLWARDARLLSQVIDILNGDVKEVQVRVHKDVKYSRRLEANGHANFYYLEGPLLAFSTQEEMIRQVIDRLLERKAKGDSRAGGFLVEQLQRLGADKALAVVLVNPRAFDAHIRKSMASAKDAAAYLYQPFFRYWQALEGVALSISIPEDFEIKLAVKANPEKLPAALRRFLTQATRPSELWARFPPNALVAMAGRIDAVAFAEFLGEFLPAEARRAMSAQVNQALEASLGLNLTQDILPNIGPDLGLCVTTPEDNKTLIPHMIGALRVQPGSKKEKVDKALFNGLKSLAFMGVLAYNAGTKSSPLKLSTAMQDEVEVKYLENDKLFPAGLKPAFALKEGYLLLASTPEAIRTFGKSRETEKHSQDVPLLRASLKSWSTFLKNRREALIAYLTGKDGLDEETATRQVDSLVWGLSLFDRLELSQRTGAGMVTWTLRVVPAKDTSRKR